MTGTAGAVVTITAELNDALLEYIRVVQQCKTMDAAARVKDRLDLAAGEVARLLLVALIDQRAAPPPGR